MTYARALMHASITFALAHHADLEPEALVEQLKEVRAGLLADAVTLINHKLIDGQLSALNGTAKQNHLMEDVMLLTNLLRRAWPAIQGKTPLTLEAINRAESLVLQLMQASGIAAKQAARPAHAIDTRLRAFTVFILAYEEVCRAVIYLRYHNKEYASYLPRIYGNGRPRKRKTTETKKRATKTDNRVSQPQPAAEPKVTDSDGPVEPTKV